MSQMREEDLKKLHANEMRTISTIAQTYTQYIEIIKTNKKVLKKIKFKKC